jgi:hypothetical protein
MAASLFKAVQEWSYTVPTHDLIVPIVGFVAAAAFATLNGCGDNGFCYCLEQDYGFRVPLLLSFYTTSVLIETAFAYSLLSWVPGYPLLMGTFITTNKAMPRWLYGTGGQRDELCGSGECPPADPSIHLGLIIAGTVCEAAVAIYRSWKSKQWITFVCVTITVLLFCILFLVEQGVEVPWLGRARGVLSPTTLVLTRAVAVSTMHRRRRGAPSKPDTVQEKQEAASSAALYSALPLVSMRSVNGF